MNTQSKDKKNNTQPQSRKRYKGGIKRVGNKIIRTRIVGNMEVVDTIVL